MTTTNTRNENAIPSQTGAPASAADGGFSFVASRVPRALSAEESAEVEALAQLLLRDMESLQRNLRSLMADASSFDIAHEAMSRARVSLISGGKGTTTIIAALSPMSRSAVAVPNGGAL